MINPVRISSNFNVFGFFEVVSRKKMANKFAYHSIIFGTLLAI